MDDTISVEVCKGVKKVSFDYAQSVVKVFLDAKLPCKSKEGTDCGNYIFSYYLLHMPFSEVLFKYLRVKSVEAKIHSFSTLH